MNAMREINRVIGAMEGVKEKENECQHRLSVIAETIVIEGGYYVDNRNNKWNTALYTLEDVRNAGLINCINCTDCVNCTNCRDCVACYGCDNCSYCIECTEGTHNIYCYQCDDCDYLENRAMCSCIGER
jgi:hypothetical protein